MTEKEIENAIFESIKEINSDKLFNESDLKSSSNVYTDLGMDSPAGLNFILAMEFKFGIQYPENTNPFVNDKEKKFNSISDIVRITKEIIEQSQRNV